MTREEAEQVLVDEVRRLDGGGGGHGGGSASARQLGEALRVLLGDKAPPPAPRLSMGQYLRERGLL